MDRKQKVVDMLIWIFGVWMLLIAVMTAFTVSSCGVQEQDLVNPMKKAGRDINSESIRGHRRLSNAYIKAERDTTRQAGRSGETVKKAGARANYQVLDNSRKVNMDIISEKNKLTDRLVGSDEKQIEANTRAIAMLRDNLQSSLEDLEAILREEIQSEDEVLTNWIRTLSEDVSLSLDELEQEILDLADTIEEDTTCSVKKVRRPQKRVTITCGDQRVRFLVN